MKLKLELHFPEFFFDSAKGENEFESSSEQISKAILQDILGYSDVRRGDPLQHEPDYMSSAAGYEVTLGIGKSLIPILRGRQQKFDNASRDQEECVIHAILQALSQKSKKVYSVKPTLIIFTIFPLFVWYSYFYLKDCNSYPYWKMCQARRNELFEKITEEYIGSNKPFENVLIIQPTHDERYILYDINAYARDLDFMTQIGINEDSKILFPRYKLISFEPGLSPMTQEITVVMYKSEDNANGQT